MLPDAGADLTRTRVICIACGMEGGTERNHRRRRGQDWMSADVNCLHGWKESGEERHKSVHEVSLEFTERWCSWTAPRHGHQDSHVGTGIVFWGCPL